MIFCKSRKNRMVIMFIFLLNVIVSFSFLPMEISANENSDSVSDNQLSNDESDKLLIQENEMQSESSTIIASGSRGENQEIKWTLDSEGLLYVYGTGENIDLSYLAYHTNKADMIKSAKIQISGSFYFARMFDDCPALEEVDFMDSNYKALSLYYMFYNCLNLKKIHFSNINTSNATDMSCMFLLCKNLESLDLSNFNTGKVTNMRAMFNSCDKLKVLDISHFDTSNVTDMEGMFGGCGALETLELSGFNTRNVTDMGGMFVGCSSLEILKLSGFNTSNVTNMRAMFNSCDKLKVLDISHFDTNNVENMNGMFSYCYSLENLNLSSFNTSNVVNMNGMFTDCVSLKTLDLSKFDTNKVTDMKAMFHNCSSLQSVDLSSFNTENLTDMTSMFLDCQSLQNIDLSEFKTDKVTSMKYMFYGCESLKSLDISNFDLSSLVYEDGEGMKIFSTMDNIETIKMPANLTYSIALPYEHYIDSFGAQKIRKATWYDQSGNQCYSILAGLPYKAVYSIYPNYAFVQGFASRMYTTVLNRPAESEGLHYWTMALINQEVDGAGIAKGFIYSDEFKNRNLNNSDYVDVLYRTFFDREPDAEGKNYWMSLLSGGTNRYYILSQFVNSQEFSEICSMYGINRGVIWASSVNEKGVRDFVLRMYTKALNREGETDGVNYWSECIITAESTPEEVAKNFFSSQEFINRKLSDADYVETLYATYFDRVSDAEGKAYWLNQMQSGMNRDAVLTEFAYSQEFRLIMSGYGL